MQLPREELIGKLHPLSPMQFILVIDVLNSLICQATQLGFLQPLAMERGQHRISLYADDVIMFLWPNTNDHNLLKELLDIVGQVSGLVANIAKSSVSPIQCSDDDRVLVSNIQSCEIRDFSLHLPWTSFEYPKNQQSGLAKTG